MLFMNPFQNPCPAVSAQVQVFQPHRIPLRFQPSITAVTSVMPEKIGLCGDTDADSVPFELLRKCPCSRVLRLAGLIAVSDRTKKRLFLAYFYGCFTFGLYFTSINAPHASG